MSPYLGIADYLGILDASGNKVMMKTMMKGNGYFNARPYSVIDKAILGE